MRDSLNFIVFVLKILHIIPRFLHDAVFPCRFTEFHARSVINELNFTVIGKFNRLWQIQVVVNDIDDTFILIKLKLKFSYSIFVNNIR